MVAEIIDGKAYAEKALAEVKSEIEATGISPHLACVQVGEDPASAYYIKSQQKKSEELGIRYSLVQLPATITQDELLAEIERLNRDADVSGIIMMVPFPKGLDSGAAQQAVDYRKDVEGTSPTSLGLLFQDRPHLVPCTAKAAVELLESAVPELEGLDVTIVGRSVTVGKPIALLLLSKAERRSCTVTICHTRTRDLASKVRQADVVFAAVGSAAMIKGDWIKPGAVVIDVGINRVKVLDENGQPALKENGKPKMKTVGDVEFATACEVASKITPVPGGVGSVTTAILMRNTLEAAKLLHG